MYKFARHFDGQSHMAIVTRQNGGQATTTPGGQCVTALYGMISMHVLCACKLDCQVVKG